MREYRIPRDEWKGILHLLDKTFEEGNKKGIINDKDFKKARKRFEDMGNARLIIPIDNP